VPSRAAVSDSTRPSTSDWAQSQSDRSNCDCSRRSRHRRELECLGARAISDRRSIIGGRLLRSAARSHADRRHPFEPARRWLLCWAIIAAAAASAGIGTPLEARRSHSQTKHGDKVALSRGPPKTLALSQVTQIGSLHTWASALAVSVVVVVV
jgi:hypothetical protein